MSKKEKGFFEATTEVLKWNGKEYRVAPDVAKAIKSRKEYSETAPKKKAVAKKEVKDK